MLFHPIAHVILDRPGSHRPFPLVRGDGSRAEAQLRVLAGHEWSSMGGVHWSYVVNVEVRGKYTGAWDKWGTWHCTWRPVRGYYLKKSHDFGLEIERKDRPMLEATHRVSLHRAHAHNSMCTFYTTRICGDAGDYDGGGGDAGYDDGDAITIDGDGDDAVDSDCASAPS